MKQIRWRSICAAKILQVGLAGQHADGIDAGTEAGCNIGIDPISDHDGLAYPNADGEIMIIAPIPSLAGPAYFYETIHLGLGAAD